MARLWVAWTSIEIQENSFMAHIQLQEGLPSIVGLLNFVQRGGKSVTSEDIARARQQSATDKEIHDTVLIAAAFCMYNRYVDGLATWAPTDPQMYRENGKRLTDDGYVASTDRLVGAQ